MITEDYVSFETAKLLKEKGFDWESIGYYVDDEPNDVKYSLLGETNSIWESRCCSAPTLQMAMKWLREIHDLNCQVMLDSWSEAYGSCGYYYMINQKNGGFREISPDDSIFFDSYEDAVEAAIEYCLEHLI